MILVAFAASALLGCGQAEQDVNNAAERAAVSAENAVSNAKDQASKAASEAVSKAVDESVTAAKRRASDTVADAKAAAQSELAKARKELPTRTREALEKANAQGQKIAEQMKVATRSVIETGDLDPASRKFIEETLKKGNESVTLTLMPLFHRIADQAPKAREWARGLAEEQAKAEQGPMRKAWEQVVQRLSGPPQPVAP